MKKTVLISFLTLSQTVLFSQFDHVENVKFKALAKKSGSNQNKSAVVGNCGLDTVRYAENKAYYLEAGFNDPTTGGWSVNKLTTSSNIVTTAYKVPAGGSVTVSGAEVLGLIMLTGYGSIATATSSTHTVYLYNVDGSNMPTGLPIDSANMVFTNNFASQTATFINGTHTMTSDFAIGVKGGATSSASHYLYVAYNQMHVASDAVNPYGEHLSFKYQPAVPGFIDMATNFGNAIYDFEFATYPILSYNFAVDFSQSLVTACPSTPITLTNTSTGSEIFSSHSFSLGAFATRYNVPEGLSTGQLPRDSIYEWYTGINTDVQTNTYGSITFTTQSTPGTYNDTLYVLALTHDYNYCYQRQIIPYTVVAAPVTPTFTTASTLCSGSTAPILGTTSTNSIVGTWSPATVDNMNTATYTFTPSSSYCATTLPLTITVNTPVTPTFTIASSICSGATAPTLATVSNNTISGTWSPTTVSNTTGGTYTFTPGIGECATSTTASVAITSNVTPTFTAVAPFCSGSAAPTLATTSNNSIVGTWSPATVSNTATATYTFTPNAGVCATTATTTVTVNTPTTPAFSFLTTICSGGSVPTLATTSDNAITGSWSPATVDNMNSATYTFTPTGGQCAASTTSNITVTTSTVTPTFTTATTLCSGATAPVLATTSTNAINGTWSPSTVDNMNTGTYTFTPTAGQCAATVTTTITVSSATVTPTFSIASSICSGATPPSLPLTSNNSVTGTWSPSTVNNANTGTYTFTPTSGTCAATIATTITVNSIVLPTFSSISPLCYGETAPVLPTTSNNSITGTWTPSTVDNTNTTAYSFAPSSGQCASYGSLTIVVIPLDVPVFTLPATICLGETAPILGTTSNNSLSGTWSPSVVNNSTVGVGTYVFTATSGACPGSLTATISVEDCSGIDEISVGSFAVYPNPSNDVIVVSFTEKNKVETILFYSVDGKLIEARDSNNTLVETFDVKQITKGMYYFQIGDVTQKVIVQ